MGGAVIQIRNAVLVNCNMVAEKDLFCQLDEYTIEIITFGEGSDVIKQLYYEFNVNCSHVC